MKKTQRRDLFATIRRTIVSFISIIVFIALGSGIYLGFDWTGHGLQQTLHDSYEKGNAHDIEITFPYGLNDDDIEELSNVDSVDDVEGQYIGYEYFTHGDDQCQAKIVSLPDEIDTFVAVKGELPQSDNEIAVETGSANTLGIKIGDEIKLKQQNGTAAYMIQQAKSYNSDNGTLPDFSNSDSYYLNSDTLVVTAIVESPEYFSISSSSYGVSTSTGSAVDCVFFAPADSFNSQIINSYNSVLIRSDSLRGLNTFSTEYKKAAAAIKKDIAPVAKEIAKRNYSLVKDNGDKLLKKIKEKIDSEEKTIEQYEQIYSGINSSNLTEARNNLAQSKENYSDFQKALDGISNYDVTPLLRSNNICYIYNKLIADIIIKLKYSLGGLFLIIGILVCYSVITRLVNSQKNLIGTKKANGFYYREILSMYLSYVGVAGGIGIIAGIAMAYFAVEKILAPYVDGTFTFNCMDNYFSWNLLPLLILELALMLAISYLGCRNVLRLDAAELLQGESLGKSRDYFFMRWRLYKRLPVFKQAIINNTIKDHRRVFATLVGISGCMALLVSCITLENNVIKSFKSQYDNYYNFDCIVYFDSQDSKAQEKIDDILSEEQISHYAVYRTDGYSYNDEFSKKLTSMIVYQDYDQLKPLINLETTDGEKNFKSTGVYLPECLKYHYNLDDNTTATYSSFNGNKANFKLSGFYKAHSYNLICYMDSKTYEDLFKEDYKSNAFIIKAGTNLDKLKDRLEKVDGYTQTYEFYRSDRDDAAVFETVAKAMVAVYFVVAILMAIFVILNLLSSFVMEKKTEIIVLMINGYDRKSARRYVAHDTMLLTVLGILIGLIAGILMGRLSIASFENEYLYLLHGMDITACLIGVATTTVLSLIMSIIAFRKIKHFSLSDINK